MLLSNISKLINCKKIYNLKKNNLSFNHISTNSKNIEKNSLLIIENNKLFKKEFIIEAIKKGAIAVITSIFIKDIKTPQFITSDTSNSLRILLKHINKNPPKNIIGITGTNGKTTTTMLTYKILKDAGFNVGIAGNIGSSFALQVAQTKFDYFVLEISSFQLDDIRQFAPHIAVITNITPDHLDRYNYNFEDYIKSKLRIFKNQSEKDFFLFNAEDPVLKRVIKKKNLKSKKIPLDVSPNMEGVSARKNQIIIKHNKKRIMINSAQFQLSGRHNLLNAMAASTIASLLNVSKDSIRESLYHYKGAPHRMEKVLTIQHVQYINDSKATNINATFFAIDSINSPLVWIVGGVDKGNDYNELLPMIRKKAKAIICLGLDNQKLRDTFENISEIFIETQSMSEAVKIAHKISVAKDTVLLSPACASFDLFKNYEDRGNQFKNAVRNV